MLSAQEFQLVNNLIRNVIECEKQLEFIRQELCQNPLFSLQPIFQRFDQKRQGSVNAGDLLQFCEDNLIELKTKEAFVLVRRLDYNNDGVLTFEDITKAFLPRNDTRSRIVTAMREPYFMHRNMYLPLEIEKGITIFVQELLEHIRQQQKIKFILLSLPQFNVYNVYRAIDSENKGYIQFENLIQFLNCGKQIAEEDLSYFFYAADQNDDGKISCNEFLEILMNEIDSAPMVSQTQPERKSKSIHQLELRGSYPQIKKQNLQNDTETKLIPKTQWSKQTVSNDDQRDRYSHLKEQPDQANKLSTQLIYKPPKPQMVETANKSNIGNSKDLVGKVLPQTSYTQIKFQNDKYRSNSTVDIKQGNLVSQEKTLPIKLAFQQQEEKTPPKKKSQHEFEYSFKKLSNHGETPFKPIQSTLVLPPQGLTIEKQAIKPLSKYSQLLDTSIKDVNYQQSKLRIPQLQNETTCNKVYRTYLNDIKNPQELKFQNNGQGPTQKSQNDDYSYSFFRLLLKEILVFRDIEEQKKQLALRSDFNLLDTFRIFDKQGRGLADLEDLGFGLQNLGLQVSANHLQLILNQFSKHNDRLLRYSDFCRMIIPLNDDYMQQLQKRPPTFKQIDPLQDIFSLTTLQYLQDLIHTIITAELTIQRYKSEVYAQPEELFNMLKEENKNYLDVSCFQDLFNNHDTHPSTEELNMLICRFNGNQIGNAQISLDHFIKQLL